jgi:hypothetical protein
VEVTSPEPDSDVGDDAVNEETLVVASGDLAIVSFEAVDPPSGVLLGQPVVVTLRKVIANYGPSTPMDAALTRTATAPVGSTVAPTLSVSVEAALAPDAPRTVSEPFTLTCDEAGTQVFVFTNEIQPLHAEDGDPIPGNNTATVEVAIDCVVPAVVNIKPGSDPNSINLRNKGVIPIAVLTTEAGEYGTPVGFDATLIDPLSVRFGPYDEVWAETGGAFEAHDRGHIEDSLELDETTRDGDLDMVLHFDTQETDLAYGDERACAKGIWRDGEGNVHTFFGCDAVRILGK